MLILFDIDGTLVTGAANAHAQALYTAIAEVHGIRVSDVVFKGSPAGRTDGEIARLILLDAGVSAQRIDERADDVRAECCRVYAEICPSDLSSTVLDGIPDLLAWLASLDGVRLALVTGNFEPVARIKLARAGVGHHFPVGQGAFGSDHEDRAALPPIARRRAGSDGISYKRERTLVIGDTPRDIACARADQLRCFAVTTGPFGADELTGADAIASGPGQLRELVGELLATVQG
ncbi:MAG: HAD family hydrolase [Solirubrobacteraceae bacterium]